VNVYHSEPGSAKIRGFVADDAPDLRLLDEFGIDKGPREIIKIDIGERATCCVATGLPRHGAFGGHYLASVVPPVGLLATNNSMSDSP
jgi:hypothetical protein